MEHYRKQMMLTHLDKKLPMYIEAFGWNEGESEFDRPAGYHCYHWLHTTGGAGEFRFSGQKITLSANKGLQSMVRYFDAGWSRADRLVRRRLFRRTTCCDGSQAGEGPGRLHRNGRRGALYIELFRERADEIGLTRLDGLPEGVQISVRRKGHARYLFVLNLSRKPNSSLLMFPIVTSQSFNNASARPRHQAEPCTG